MIKPLLKHLWPPCQNCDTPSQDLLCAVCLEKLRFKNACPDCGQNPLAKNMRRCLSCSSAPKSWNETYVSFIYADGIRAWIHDIKDRSKPERWRELMLNHLPPISENIDVLIPVTPDPSKTRKRLFDTSLTLALRVGHLIDRPVLQDVFERKVFLESQQKLNRAERLRYLNQLIGLKQTPGPLGRVLLVDDVMTTGGSAEAHARLLKPFAKSIDLYCVSRALKAS